MDDCYLRIKTGLFLKEVKMIFHQSIGVQMERSGFVFRRIEEISLKISFVQEDGLLLISPGDHMAESAGKMNARFPSHEDLVPPPRCPINTLLSLPHLFKTCRKDDQSFIMGMRFLEVSDII